MWIYIIIFIVLSILSINYNELFTNKKRCPYPEKNYPSKCDKNTLHPNMPCLHCEYRRPHLTVYDNPLCCRNLCYYRKPIGKPYYCKDHQACMVKYAINDEDRYCGFNRLNTLPEKIYDTQNECLRDLNPFQNLSKNECLNRTDTGWCTDFLGEGLCVQGTPTGPTDMVRYNMCYVNQWNETEGRNRWFYGKNKM